MKALINTKEKAGHIIGWEQAPHDSTILFPKIEMYSNGVNICQIETEEFEVHEDLIWVDCDDTINTHDFYYDTDTQEFKLVINTPRP